MQTEDLLIYLEFDFTATGYRLFLFTQISGTKSEESRML